MKSITIRELHLHTGKWVRETAATRQSLLVLDHGRPTARLVPLEDSPGTPFRERTLVPGFASLPPVMVDSARLLEEDRR